MNAAARHGKQIKRNAPIHGGHGKGNDQGRQPETSDQNAVDQTADHTRHKGCRHTRHPAQRLIRLHQHNAYAVAQRQYHAKGNINPVGQQTDCLSKGDHHKRECGVYDIGQVSAGKKAVVKHPDENHEEHEKQIRHDYPGIFIFEFFLFHKFQNFCHSYLHVSHAFTPKYP